MPARECNVATKERVLCAVRAAAVDSRALAGGQARPY